MLRGRCSPIRNCSRRGPDKSEFIQISQMRCLSTGLLLGVLVGTQCDYSVQDHNLQMTVQETENMSKSFV